MNKLGTTKIGCSNFNHIQQSQKQQRNPDNTNCNWVQYVY